VTFSLAVRPHPAAPLFAVEANPALVLKQVFEEVAAGRFPMNTAFLSVLRQACYVSLFFFLKHVASVTGPYDLLDEDMDLEMCNFMQSDDAQAPGTRSAMILFRGARKSTIGNHGCNSWEALRNPDIRIRNVSSIIERAHEFKNVSQRTFDSNPLVRELFGKHTFNPTFDADPHFRWKGYIPRPSAPRWNDNEWVLPNRTRFFIEPTVGAGGATGASEGVHVDKLVIDDINGLDDLGADRRANVNMFQKKRWFATNTTSLLVDRTSRIHLNGTFYGSTDVQSDVMDDCKRIVGWQDPDFKANPRGSWVVYYRSWKEGERVTKPEVMDDVRYAKLLRDDPWSAITQYANKRHDPAGSEFQGFETKRATLLWSEKHSQYFLRRGPAAETEDENWDDDIDERFTRLGACDVVMTIDPAGTEKGMTAKTSRSAVGVVAMDSAERVYLCWSRTGYYGPVKLFDLIFEGNAKFGGIVRETGCESAAMQKIIAPLLERERVARRQYINIVPVPAGGDKEGRIRMNVGRALMQGRVYLCYGEEVAFEEERLVFPGNEYKRDTLDMFEKALTRLRKPLSREDEEEQDVNPEDLEYVYAAGRSEVTGY
jgi:hypothetical protein